MANDLYGELLARALQRRAPPGHFPAFVTPGEANLLRSQGGGVAPGGGQYMAGGIPAFFSEADPNPGYGGGAMGFEDFGTLGVNTAPGGMLGEFGGLGFDAGNLGFGVSEGEHGRSPQDIAREAARIAAARNIAIAIEEAQTRNIQQDQPVAPAVAPTISIEPAPEVSAPPAVSLAQDVEDVTSAISSQVNPSFAAGVEDFTPGGMETPGFEGEQGIGTPTDPGDTDSDAGVAAQQAAMEMAQHEVNTGRMSQAQAFSALDAPIDRGGLGRFSPAVGWGINSETGLASFADLAALNAQDHQGYAITNPQPTEASILASQVFAQLNPTITNAVIGLAGFLPGPVGFAATIAGLIENKGLMNIPAVQSIPGVSAISEGLASARGKIGDVISGITDPITGPIGEALSAGQQAVADALSGILGPEESAGFEDAGEVEGGALDIEIVPPIATDTDAAPAPTARTYAEVDAKKKERILANILAGLTRTERPTEGVTAFGPLFVDER
jgi:hypothetical protein